jgi:hypothetical protein
MAAYAFVGQPSDSKGVEFALAVLRGSSAASGTSDTQGVCILRGLTANSKVAMEAGLQLSVAAAMAVLYVSVLVGQRLCAPMCSRRSRARPGGRVHVVLSLPESRRGLTRVTGETRESPQHGLQGDGYAALPDGPEPALIDICVASDAGLEPRAAAPPPPVQGRDAPRPPLTGPINQDMLRTRPKVVAAAVNFGLSAYATLTTAVFKLLHCVRVPGTPPHQRRLFIQGSVTCDYAGWQLPLVMVVVVLTATPLLLPWVAAWSRRKPRHTPRDASKGGEGGRRGCCAGQVVADLRVGVRRALVETYTPGLFWWEAVLMAQRLVRASCWLEWDLFFCGGAARVLRHVPRPKWQANVRDHCGCKLAGHAC